MGAKTLQENIEEIFDSPESVLKKIETPVFKNAKHRWEAYVPDELRELWDQLSVETRLCVYHTARSALLNED